MKKAVLFILPLALFLSVVLAPGTSSAEATTQSSSEKLISLAKEQNLALSPQWHALLHYKQNSITSGFTSYADDPAFFLAEDGRTNPSTELEATINAFFDQNSRAPWNKPVRCIFVARYAWLKDTLAPASQSLPDPACPEFDEWYGLIAPHGLSAILASSYLNNPASAFGHTFLRFDRDNQTDKTRLLAYTANYSADAVDENALLYAIRGIFGGYSGFFAVAPYYEKVKIYNDMERRDLWEYELSLTPAEVSRVVQHLWELRKISFNYFYFDENCSFQLLSLIEVARPSLHLLDQFYGWVIPVDTLRAVLANNGLLKDVAFRPSTETKLRNRIDHTPVIEQTLAKDIATKAIEPLAPEVLALPQTNQARSLDLAYEYLDYRIQSISGRAPKEEGRALEILKARSTITDSQPIPKPTQPSKRPDEGHKSNKAALATGWDSNHMFLDFSWQPAYHSLLDPSDGFLRGAQIQMLAIKGRLEETRGVNLQEFTLLDLTSLTPRDRFIHPMSWTFHLTTEREHVAENKENYTTKLEGGAGATWELPQGFWFYAFAAPSSKAASWLEHDYALGIGPRAGILLEASSQLAFGLDATYARYFVGDTHNTARITFQSRYTLSTSTALYLEARHDNIASESGTQVSLGVGVFF